MKKIAVGDLGEFWYGDYKEPFVQLEGAVPGYPQGVVLKADDGKLLCPWCGRTFDHLGNHSRLAHGLPARQFKEEVGLLQKTALISERHRQALIASGLRRWRAGAMPPPSIKGEFGHGRAVPPRANWQQTAEAENRTGQCLAQMVAVARSIAGQGLSVTHAQLRRYGIGEGTVTRYAGSIERLRTWVKSRPPQQTQRRLSENEMLEGLVAVALDLGRTPTRSDIRRYGLPATTTYANHFGSYGAACKRVKLPINLPVPRPISGDERLAIITAYAVYPSMEYVRGITHLSLERVRAVLASFDIEPLPTNHRGREAQRALAADIARRFAGWPEESAA